MGAQNAKNDLENYRAGYPDEVDDPDAKENLRFYKGERASEPDGDYIDNIHKKWKGKYSLLERHHGYIQWLFPIQEHGMNYQSQKLQKHEIEGIKADPACLERILRSYELMLDFYGLVLKDRQTGELARSDNYKERYYNLNTSSHNYLRITRILKCLGEMGFEHMKLPFLEFMTEEVYVHKELRNIKSSLANYWSGTLRNDDERRGFLAKIDQYEEKEREARGPAGGARPGGYGAGAGGYAGYGAGNRGRLAAMQDSSSDDDGMEDSSDDEGEDEGLTVAEKVKRQAKGTAATAATAANPAGEEKEEQKTEEKEDGNAGVPAPLGTDDRCCQGKAGDSPSQSDLGNESVGTQELESNHDIVN